MPSLRAQFEELRQRSASRLTRLFGETITIGDATGIAAITSPTIGSDYVSGGEYLQVDLVALLQKTDWPEDFAPSSGMTATARGRELRVAPGGVTEFAHSWRVPLVARNVPS